jgi:hypothetical protein
MLYPLSYEGGTCGNPCGKPAGPCRDLVGPGLPKSNGGASLSEWCLSPPVGEHSLSLAFEVYS